MLQVYKLEIILFYFFFFEKKKKKNSRPYTWTENLSLEVGMALEVVGWLPILTWQWILR